MKRAALALLLACTASSAIAQETCRQALALGLDVSGSVDAREYRQQLEGLATALGSPAVRAALFESPEAPVEFLVYEWSGPRDQLTLVPWSRIAKAADLDRVIEQLTTTERRTEATPGTALGVAVLHGASLLAQRAHCWKATLDISGDGKSNLGPRPRTLKPRLSAQGVTVNALVIGPPDQGNPKQSAVDLSSYFSAEVIVGSDAFVEVSAGFADYAATMERKLLRELEGLVLSSR